MFIFLATPMYKIQIVPCLLLVMKIKKMAFRMFQRGPLKRLPLYVTILVLNLLAVCFYQLFHLLDKCFFGQRSGKMADMNF